MGVVNIFPIINLDQWKENLMIQASGTRMKRWIINPDTGEQVLAKWPNYGTGEALRTFWLTFYSFKRSPFS